MPVPRANLLNAAPDISADFGALENVYFLANALTEWDMQTRRGTLEWRRITRKPRMAFDQVVTPYEESEPWEFPPAYERHPALPIAVDLVGPTTLRVRLTTRPDLPLPDPDAESPMLVAPPTDCSEQWRTLERDDHCIYTSEAGFLKVTRDPFHLELWDPAGRPMLRSAHASDGRALTNCEPMPFAFARRGEDLSRRIAASFRMAPNDRIYGCGESFTRLNKRGQKLHLWPCDPHSAQTPRSYKPVPFFMSSRGYGMFIHTSAPLTLDFGHDYDEMLTVYSGDETLDIFFFLGSPKQIVEAYTALTGRSPLPPLWSFGLWMSRITYKSEAETRQVAAKLRAERIPSDVIHLDTGWFETDWQCDYQFSLSRFDDPVRMLKDLKLDGFHVSLWQLPYFTPTNRLHAEIREKGLDVRGPEGGPATEDAVLDFTNPETVAWYQGLLGKLFDQGVAAIKVDFGEQAPRHGRYHSGRSGWLEHNLYPLHYNRVVAEVTQAKTGHPFIWARSAWAGSQRYPVHWGGDAETTDSGMAATLRAGLSLGLCGFSYWSHDVGGFTRQTPRHLYRRWLPFGMLTSHSRCHGAPPTEPWEYDPEFVDDFRRAVELKYRLMAYIYAQAKIASEHGWPMLRPLFMEYPQDPTSWMIEDEYLFGSDLLVAPLMEESKDRLLYLPPGNWIDLQSRSRHEGGSWKRLVISEIPCIILVREGAVIPWLQLAQHTGELDWTQIELEVYAPTDGAATGSIYRPGDAAVTELRIDREAGVCLFHDDEALPSDTSWTIRAYDDHAG